MCWYTQRKESTKSTTSPSFPSVEGYPISCATNPGNINLTEAQKLLMTWHFRLGHFNLKAVQLLLKTVILGDSPAPRSASKCDLPKCPSCQYGKAKRRPTTQHLSTEKQQFEKHLSEFGVVVLRYHISYR